MILMVRRRRPSSTMLKDLLQNCVANQSQILCGASMGRWNEACSRHLGHSHDQDGHRARLW